MPLTWLNVLTQLLRCDFFSTRSPDDADSVETMSDVHNHVVETERIGKLHVYVQGRTWTVRARTRPNSCFLEQYLPNDEAREISPGGLISD